MAMEYLQLWDRKYNWYLAEKIISWWIFWGSLHMLEMCLFVNCDAAPVLTLLFCCIILWLLNVLPILCMSSILAMMMTGLLCCDSSKAFSSTNMLLVLKLLIPNFYTGNLKRVTIAASWDGIQCDGHTGHVISIYLSSSFFHGSLNSNSTLFQLFHLRRLSLADNYFNGSKIPPLIGQFSRLTCLNLSVSAFFGQVPSENFHLSNLSSLDISRNYDITSGESFWNLEVLGLMTLYNTWLA